MIEVRSQGGGDPLNFSVAVREADGETRHAVTLTAADHAQLAKDATPEALIEAAFAFLIDREPKEAILSRFDVSVISRYFPEFASQLPRYLTARR